MSGTWKGLDMPGGTNNFYVPSQLAHLLDCPDCKYGTLEPRGVTDNADMECADCGRVYTWEELNSLGVTQKKPAQEPRSYQEPRNYKPTECEKWVANIGRRHDALCREITQLEDLLKEIPGKIKRLRADEKEASQKLDDEMLLWALSLARDGMSLSRIKEKIGKTVTTPAIDSIWRRQFRSHWERYRHRGAPARSVLSNLRSSPPLHP